MAVYKEAMYLLNELSKLQKQIYNDAADFGVPVYSLKDRSINLAKQLIDFYGEETDSRQVDRYSTGKTVTREIHLIDEFGDQKEFVVKLSYTTVQSRKNDHSSLVGQIVGILNVESPKWIN